MVFADLLREYGLSPELFDVTAPPPVKEPKQQVTPPWGTGIPVLHQGDEPAENDDYEHLSDLDELDPPF
jgi:hypothetical protein